MGGRISVLASQAATVYIGIRGMSPGTATILLSLDCSATTPATTPFWDEQTTTMPSTDNDDGFDGICVGTDCGDGGVKRIPYLWNWTYAGAAIPDDSALDAAAGNVVVDPSVPKENNLMDKSPRFTIIGAGGARGRRDVNALPFKLDAKTGSVVVSGSLNATTKSQYAFEVLVVSESEDSNYKGKKDTVQVAITITGAQVQNINLDEEDDFEPLWLLLLLLLLLCCLCCCCLFAKHREEKKEESENAQDVEETELETGPFPAGAEALQNGSTPLAEDPRGSYLDSQPFMDRKDGQRDSPPSHQKNPAQLVVPPPPGILAANSDDNGAPPSYEAASQQMQPTAARMGQQDPYTMAMNGQTPPGVLGNDDATYEMAGQAYPTNGPPPDATYESADNMNFSKPGGNPDYSMAGNHNPGQPGGPMYVNHTWCPPPLFFFFFFFLNFSCKF